MKRCKLFGLWRQLLQITSPIVSIARREILLLAILGILAGSFWIFVNIADEVIEGDTRAFDEAVIMSLRTHGDARAPIGPSWVQEIGRDATALGGVGVLTFITLAAIGFLALRGQGRQAVSVALAVASGIAFSLALKAGFDRPRPELVPYDSVVYTSSFPSGHSMMAALVYLTLGALLARLQPKRRLKAYIMALAIFVTFAVGISRIYLGVHWPTDVIGGWAAGAAWATLSWLTVLGLQRLRND